MHVIICHLVLRRFPLRLIFSGVLLLSTLAPRGWAQEDACLIQADKAFYVTGEVMWFKLWLPLGYGERSELIQVQVIRPEGSIADRFYLRSGEGGADGYFRVPFDWPSGVYRLRFSATTAQGGELLELGMAALPVYNDREQKVVSTEKMNAEPAVDVDIPKGFSLEVALATDRGVYRSRDSVRVVVEVKDRQGRPVPAQLSVAVTDRQLCGRDIFSGPTLFAGRPMSPGRALDSLILLRGTVQDAQGRPFNSSLLTAWGSPPDTGVMVSTSPSGVFQVRLPVFWGDGGVQLFDYKQDGLQVRPESEPVFPAAPGLVYTSGVLRYLDLSRQRKRVYQLYDTLELSPSPQAVLYPEITREPNRRLFPGNYEGIESIPDFFREVASPLSFRLRQDEYIARMYNPEPHMKKNYGGPPLFIIDGRLTRNAQFVTTIDISEVETIDLYNDYSLLRRRFGAIGRYGVVEIRTKSKKTSLPEADLGNFIALSGLQLPASFPVISFAENRGEYQAPAFRPQVFWVPSVSTDASGRAVLAFPLGDDISRFRILVTARGSAGTLGIGESTVEVR